MAYNQVARNITKKWLTIRLARNIKSKIFRLAVRAKTRWLTIRLARNIKSKSKDSVAYNQASTQY